MLAVCFSSMAEADLSGEFLKGEIEIRNVGLVEKEKVSKHGAQGGCPTALQKNEIHGSQLHEPSRKMKWP